MVQGPARVACWLAVCAMLGCGDDASLPTGSGETGPDPEPPAYELPGAGVTSWACEPGDIEQDDGSCVPAGVTGCGIGFEAHPDGGCRAVLPAMPCGPAEMAIPGEANCRPVAPCGTGTWGNIPIDGTTVFVDQAYTGGDGDGTQLKPFVTIAEALAIAQPNAIVALAAGSYDGVALDRPVRLWGVCPALTTVVATATIGIRVNEGASGTEIHDLSATGGGSATISARGADVRVERVWIHDTSWGVSMVQATSPVEDAPHVHVVGSRIDDANRSVVSFGASATVEESVLRDGEATLNSIAVSMSGPEGSGVLTLRRSVIARVFGFGVQAEGKAVNIEDFLITHVVRSPSTAGSSCLSLTDLNEDSSMVVSVSDVVAEDCEGVGMAISGVVSGEFDNITVRKARDAGKQAGLFVTFDRDGSTPRAPDVTLRHAVLDDSAGVGLQQSGGRLSIEGVRISGVVEGSGGALPLLITNQLGRTVRPVFTANGVIIEDSQNVGMSARAAEMTVNSMLIRNMAPNGLGRFGRGVEVALSDDSSQRSSAALSRTYIHDVLDAGVVVFGSDASFDNCEIADVSGASLGPGQGVVFDDRQKASSWSMTDTTIRSAQSAGVQLTQEEASSLTLERLLVEGTRSNAGAFGDGILVTSYGEPAGDATLLISDSILRDNERGGLVSLGAAVRIRDTALVCNPIAIIGEPLRDQDASVNDDGGTVCGCDGVSVECRLLSADVEAPKPLEPVEAEQAEE